MPTRNLAPSRTLSWVSSRCIHPNVQELQSADRKAFFQDCKTKYDGVTAIYRHNDSASESACRDPSCPSFTLLTQQTLLDSLTRS